METAIKTREPALVHLHPDFQDPLEDLFELWNAAQRSWRFIGLRPCHETERVLLTPGAISNDDASLLAAGMRASAGYQPQQGIIVFTEKRLYDGQCYQLFVGGHGVDENPPRIAVLSLDFLRNGPGFREDCSTTLANAGRGDLLRIAEVARLDSGVALQDERVSASIVLRGERYRRTEGGFDYDVAFSFAGDGRSCAEQLAVTLRSVGLAVFHDQFDQAKLWG
jgi:hypothetical protein